jgi:hypothetical protein
MHNNYHCIKGPIDITNLIKIRWTKYSIDYPYFIA